MKTIFKNTLFLVALLGFLFQSCSKDEYTYTYEGDNYVQLVEPSGTFFVLEDPALTYEVQFQIIGDAASEDITMPVHFLDSALTESGWVYATLMPGEKGITPLASAVTIKAGEYTGTLQIQGNYDSLEFSEVDTMLLMLTDGTVDADQYSNNFLLKVQKFYPYIPEEYPGNYGGTYTGWNMDWAVVPTSSGLDIAIGEEDNTLVIRGGFYQEQLDAWGEFWIDGDPQAITLKMNTEDESNFVVEIVGTKYMGTTTTAGGDGPYEYWVGPHPSPGQFNAATKELHIKFYSYFEGPISLNDVGEYTVQLTDEQAKALVGE